jgi:dihydroxyacetone kinase-like protein
MALTSCTVPAAGKPTFELAEEEMELGIGIHVEPGRRRVALGTAREIAEQLREPMLADLDITPTPIIRRGQPVTQTRPLPPERSFEP